jgi:hypothetical protein
MQDLLGLEDKKSEETESDTPALGVLKLEPVKKDKEARS